MLKKILLCLLLVRSFTGEAQADTSLKARLDSFLVFTEAMNIDAALDLTYPRLFTIISRDDMKKELSNTQERDDVKIRLDSLRLDTIFPVFQFEKGSYSRIVYTMNMYMQMLDEAAIEDEEEINQMIRIFELQHGEGNVTYNKEKKEIRLHIRSSMIAIRDEVSPQWTFLNLEADSPLTGILFGDKLLEKLAQYK